MANNLTGQSDDILVCPICLEQYVIPRALPCLHTFCEKCLVDWVRHKSITNTLTIGSLRCFPCPVCKDDVSVPPEGIKGFRHNFYVSNMVGEPTSPVRKLASKNCSEDDLDKTIVCNRCEEIGVSNMCIKCNIWLCPLCCEDHKRVKGTKSHFLATHANLKEVNFNDELSSDQLALCGLENHNEINALYCIQCKEMLCENCLKIKHSKHDTINIVSSLEEVRNTLLDCMGRLKMRTDVLHRQHSTLNYAKKDLVSQGHKAIRDFDKSISAIQKKMQVMKGNLQKNLKKQIADQANRLDERLMGINNKLAIEESIEEEMQALLDSGNKREIISQSQMLCEQAEKCLTTHLINSECMITVTSPIWKCCEEDLFDQLLTKLLGTCEYVGVDVNLNKRARTKKYKRTSSNSPRLTAQGVNNNCVAQSQVNENQDMVSENQLCDIIRDFDPLRNTEDEGQIVENLTARNFENEPQASNDHPIAYPPNLQYEPTYDIEVDQVVNFGIANVPAQNDENISFQVPQFELIGMEDGEYHNTEELVDENGFPIESEEVLPDPPHGPFYNNDGHPHMWLSNHPELDYPQHSPPPIPPPPQGWHRPPRHVSPRHHGSPHHPPPSPHHAMHHHTLTPEFHHRPPHHRGGGHKVRGRGRKRQGSIPQENNDA